jgi:hypothetical protein
MVGDMQAADPLTTFVDAYFWITGITLSALC